MPIKTIVLVGQPNAGKSTLFNGLSDIKISTSNFAGTTVKLNQTLLNVNGESYNLVDLPGTYSLNPSDEAEKITFEYLTNKPVDLIINVVDATLLPRSLELSVELNELGLPMVIALNMQDEAEKHGVVIDTDKLEKILNIPVIPTIAILGKGIKKLMDKSDEVIYKNTKTGTLLEYTHHLESSIERLTIELSAQLNGYKLDKRFYAIKAIENPAFVPEKIFNQVRDFSKEIARDIVSLHKKDAYESIAYERHHLAMKLSHEISYYRERKKRPFLDKLDDYLLHPVFGQGFGLLFFVLYFFAIFVIGGAISSLLDPVLNKLPLLYESLHQAHPFFWCTIDGVTQGFIGGVGIALPYFLPLLFLTSIFEETGYLARIAYLLDGLFHKLGLHGKSIIPFILGFGCSVPAVYATRVMENKRDRTLTAILINFIPCSARISVIFALSAAFTGPIWTAVIFLFVGLIIALNGRLLTIFLKKPMGLILEIPNLRVPSLKVSFKKTYIKLREFIKVALPFLVVGSIVLAWLDYFQVTNYINILFSPLIKDLLGLPVKLGSTLVFGFLRKELVVIMATQAMGVSHLASLPLTIPQVVTFIIFVIFYIPCVSTLAVLWREFGLKITVYTALLTIFVATISAYLFKIILSI